MKTHDDRERRSTADLTRDQLLDRIDALTAELDAVLERAAKVCETYALRNWHAYKNGTGPERANPNVEGRADGADELAAAIRALKAGATDE